VDGTPSRCYDQGYVLFQQSIYDIAGMYVRILS